MKKFLCSILSVIFALTLCSCGNKYEDIPFEECAGYAIGTWVDPIARFDDVVLKEDGTAVVYGESLTWKPTYSNKESKDLEYDYDWFNVTFYEGEAERYEMTFTHLPDEDVWCITSSDVILSDGTSKRPEEEGTGWYYRFRPDDVEIIKLNDENWPEYFSAMQLVTWEEPYEKDDWSCHEYIVVNPEYENRIIETNYKLGLYCEFFARPYYCEVDAENRDISLGERYYGRDEQDIVEEMYYTVNKSNYNYKEGYLTLEYIFLSKDYSDNEYLYFVEYYTVWDANGTIVLKK